MNRFLTKNRSLLLAVLGTFGPIGVTTSWAMEIPFHELQLAQSESVYNLRNELGFEGKSPTKERAEKKYSTYLEVLERSLRIQDDFIQSMLRIREVNCRFNRADETLKNVMGPAAFEGKGGRLTIVFHAKSLKSDIAAIAFRDLLIEPNLLVLGSESFVRKVTKELLKDTSDESLCFIGSVIQAKLESNLAERAYDAEQAEFLTQLQKAAEIENEVEPLCFGLAAATGKRYGGLPAKGQKFVKSATSPLAQALHNIEQYRGYFQSKAFKLSTLFVTAADEKLFTEYRQSRAEKAALWAAMIQEKKKLEERSVLSSEQAFVEDFSGSSKKEKQKKSPVFMAARSPVLETLEKSKQLAVEPSPAIVPKNVEQERAAEPDTNHDEDFCSFSFAQKLFMDLPDVVRYRVYKRYGVAREGVRRIKHFSRNVEQWFSDSMPSLMNFESEIALSEQGYKDDSSQKVRVAYEKESFFTHNEMRQRMVMYHAFPRCVDECMYSHGYVQHKTDQKTGKPLTFITLPGDITLSSGKRLQGIYTYIVDETTNTCFHRMFEPKELRWDDPRIADFQAPYEAFA